MSDSLVTSVNGQIAPTYDHVGTTRSALERTKEVQERRLGEIRREKSSIEERYRQLSVDENSVLRSLEAVYAGLTELDRPT